MTKFSKSREPAGALPAAPELRDRFGDPVIFNPLPPRPYKGSTIVNPPRSWPGKTGDVD